MNRVKWYEDIESDNSPIISSRIRLARNLKKYPFSVTINEEESEKMIKDIVSSIKNDYMSIGTQFEYVDLNKIDDVKKAAMVEKHEISPELLKYKRPRGVLVKSDESVEIMINEEDHIRIQAINAGKNIDKAWDMADKIDDIIEESVDYAFDKKFGYLTSCPSNTGTGLRASFMVHIPVIEKTGNIRNLASSLSKMGMTIRGIYGEGSESMGSIYQVSNQITLGKSEEEIIENLKSVGKHIEENEKALFDEMYANDPVYVEDNIYRSYALLKYSKQIDMKEAMDLLSSVRVGYMTGILKEKKPKTFIYNIMMNIEPGNMREKYKVSTQAERRKMRAMYLSEMFS